ncbi:hypothetical protein GE061_017329 [Apolygus lucorum]|uniref:Uncharacterized protein n=1 Tax=Apolygus lucorum TaxID=248454 RepID=A0A8S9XC54_APOLU|nr:hypothetical protein GE061_017329 [Apolygus lucorum]
MQAASQPPQSKMPRHFKNRQPPLEVNGNVDHKAGWKFQRPTPLDINLKVAILQKSLAGEVFVDVSSRLLCRCCSGVLAAAWPLGALALSGLFAARSSCPACCLFLLACVPLLPLPSSLVSVPGARGCLRCPRAAVGVAAVPFRPRAGPGARAAGPLRPLGLARRAGCRPLRPLGLGRARAAGPCGRSAGPARAAGPLRPLGLGRRAAAGPLRPLGLGRARGLPGRCAARAGPGARAAGPLRPLGLGRRAGCRPLRPLGLGRARGLPGRCGLSGWAGRAGCRAVAAARLGRARGLPGRCGRSGWAGRAAAGRCGARAGRARGMPGR